MSNSLCKYCSKVKLHRLVGPINSFLWIWISWIPWISRLQFLLQVFMMNFWDILQDKRLKLIMRFVKKLIGDIIQELFQIEITTSSVANRILSMTAAFPHKWILLSIFLTLTLVYSISMSWIFNFPLKDTIFNQNFLYIGTTLTAKTYLLLQPPEWEKSCCNRVVWFPLFVLLWYKHHRRALNTQSENKTNKAVKYSKITTISSIIKI